MIQTLGDAMVFKTFSPFHGACLGAVAMVIAVWVAIGRGLLMKSPEREAMFRRVLGAVFIVYQTWYLARFFFESPIPWIRVIPVMVCDIAALLAGVLMIWHRRWTRNLMYYWGLGLCTQAFVSPAVIENIATNTLRFWTFWIGHTLIIGTPIYDLVVHRYRPTWKDYRFVAISAAVYCGLAAGVNYWLDHSGLLAEGVHANYGYIGNTKPKAPTIIDKLGPWPERILYVAMIVYGAFALLTVAWARNRPGGGEENATA